MRSNKYSLMSLGFIVLTTGNSAFANMGRECLDLPQEIHTIPMVGHFADSAVFSNDGQRLYWIDDNNGDVYAKMLPNGPIKKVLDLNTRKVTLSVDSETASFVEGSRCKIADLKTGKILSHASARHGDTTKNCQKKFSESRNFDLTQSSRTKGSSSGTILIEDHLHKKTYELNLTTGHGCHDSEFLGSTNKIIAKCNEGLVIYDPELKRESLIASPTSDPIQAYVFSADGKQIAVNTLGRTTQIWGVSNNGTASMQYTIDHDRDAADFRNDTKFSADGSNLITVQPDRILYRNLATKSLSSVTANEMHVDHFQNHSSYLANAHLGSVGFPSPRKDFVVSVSGDNLQLISTKNLCADKPTVEDACDCGPLAPSQDSIANRPLVEIVHHQLCANRFDKQAWDNASIIPLPEHLPEKEVELYLLRFQKPGGFEPSQHFGILSSILESSSWISKHPDLITGALQGVAYSSPELYEYLLKKYPQLQSLPPLSSEFQCRVASEKRDLEEGAMNAAQAYVERNRSTLTVNSLKILSPMESLLETIRQDGHKAQAETWQKDLEKRRYDVLEDRTSDDIRDNVLKNPLTSKIFASKVSHVVDAAIGKYIGNPQEAPRTEFEATKEYSDAEIGIIGSDPIDGDISTRTNEGIYYKNLGHIDLTRGSISGADAQKVFDWTHAGKKYEATVEIKTGTTSDLVRNAPSPDYAAQWRGGNFSGMVINSGNLGGDEKDIQDEYISFFQSEGFEFGVPEPVSNIKSYMKDAIISGQVNYLITEAHSNASDESVIQTISTRGKVLTGTKTTEDGKHMTIRIFTQEGNPYGRPDNVFNTEFGSWIKARQNNNLGEFVYLNRSCHSIARARNQIPLAGKGLVVFATETTGRLFQNPLEYAHPNAGSLMVQDFIEQKSYAQMRADMLQDKEYKEYDDFKKTGHPYHGYEGNAPSYYIFPDQKEYYEDITKYFEVPATVTYEVKEK